MKTIIQLKGYKTSRDGATWQRLGGRVQQRCAKAVALLLLLE
jgi:hypothetical protein